jgi:hypothetical protein
MPSIAVKTDSADEWSFRKKFTFAELPKVVTDIRVLLA